MKENRLLAKWLNNDLSEDELAAFEASPDFEKYQKIKNISDLYKTISLVFTLLKLKTNTFALDKLKI